MVRGLWQWEQGQKQGQFRVKHFKPAGREREDETIKKLSAVKPIEQDDPVDIANLDIHFVRAFIDMLYGRCDNVGTLDIRTGTISALCHEALIKIDRLERFIAAVPLKTVKIDNKDAA